jgi:pimeloyl-ACP methyl ester carboxylesterase
MKKTIFFFVILFITIKAVAQAEPANYATAIKSFRYLYNKSEVDSIFNQFSQVLKDALPMDKFKPTTLQLKAQLGNLLKTDFVKYANSLAVYKATFEHNVFLLNISLNSNNEYNGLLLSPFKEEMKQQIPIDPDLVESAINVKTLSGNIAGSLMMPKNVSGKIPLVLIIGDAGLTDRDGNNAKAGIKANTYKLLANELGKKGIASIRYDKRSVGESLSSTKESQLRIDDYGDDVVSIINSLIDDQRFSKIVLLGHGEGALVGMIAITDQPVNGFITIEGPGEPADKMLMDQMKTKPKFIADEFKTILDSLRKGKTTDNVDPALYYIARPSYQHFLMSWCRLSPIKGIKAVKKQVLIIQGTTDLQVTVENGQKLKKAKSEAVYLEIKDMNHILKEAPADEEKNMDTFSKPDLPLKPELISGIVDFLKKLK